MSTIVYCLFLMLSLSLTEASDNEAVFKEFDSDNDGLISKVDVDTFLANNPVACGIANKDAFKLAAYKVIDKCDGGMNFDTYVAFIEEQNRLHPDAGLEAIKQRFPGKETVSKSELSEAYGLDEDSLTKDEYTIQEIASIIDD